MSRRPRGRGRKPQHNNNKNNNPNRALDSNGPDVRVRGSAKTIYDKYMALAHDASVSGRRVKAESYLQHAEHYLRIVQDLAVIAEKKAEQQRLATEQREAEQAARRAKHAAQAEKNAENKSDASDKAQEAKKEKSNGADEENTERPKRRTRSHLSRRKDQTKPDDKPDYKSENQIADKASGNDDSVKANKAKRPKKSDANKEAGEEISVAE